MIIELEGAFGESNFGDDVLLSVSIEIIRRQLPEATIRVRARPCSVPGDYLDSLPGDVRVVRENDWFRVPASRIVYAGGTQFYSFPPLRSGQLDYSEKFALLPRIARKVKRSINDLGAKFFLGIGVGPFLSGNESASSKVLRSGRFLSVRDEESSRYCLDLNANVASLGADICFSTTGSFMPSIVARVGDVRSRDKVGFIVRDFPYDMPGTGYLSEVIAVAQELKAAGRVVEFFAFSKLKDKKIIESLKDFDFDVRTWEGDFSQIEVFLRDLASCEFVISSRYHGVVLSAIVGVPSVGISLDPKVKIVCKELGLDHYEWAAPFDGVDLRTIIKRMQDRGVDSDDLRCRVGNLSRRANFMVEKFFAALVG